MRIAIWIVGTLAVIAFSAFALASTAMWALDPWLRPLVLLRLDERWLLAAAIAGWAIAAIACPGKWRGRWWWWWRAGIATVLCVGFLFAASIPARELAMRMLMRNWDIHMAFHGDPPQWEDRDGWTKHFNERWFYMGMELPEWKQIGENSIGASSSSTRYRPRFTPFDHLLETSRWPSRKLFIMRVMHDEKAVSLATRDWHRLFPSIVGQDVTLARRNKLIGLLHELSNDASAAPASRHGATFWMGLIVLTDAPAFERWRPTVRDAMLACDDPPMSHTGDVWMRVLDALLAFDADPASSVKHLTNKRALFHRAVRERVRGMDAHIPAIIREIEKFDEAGQPAAAIALWIDLKQMMDRVPDHQDHQNVRSWMRERMLKWLLDDTNAFETRFLTRHHSWANEMHDLLVDFEADQLGVLAAHAYELVISTDPGAGTKDYIKHRPYRLPTSISHALFISNFVDDERRVVLSNAIGTFFAAHFDEHVQWVTFDWRADSTLLTIMIDELSGIWQDLNHDLQAELTWQIQQSLLGENIMRIQTTHGRTGSRPTLPLNLLPFFDITLKHRSLNDAEHIALLASLNRGNHGAVSKLVLRPTTEPLEFPQEALEEFTQKLATAMDHEDSWVSFHEELHAIKFPVSWFSRFYQGFHQSTLPKKDAIRIQLVHRRLVGMEHLPDDWPRLFHSCPQVRRMAGDHDDPEIWQPLMDTPASARETLELLSEQSDLALIGLFAYLMRHPPDPEIKEAIRHHYREMAETGTPEQRRTAWHVLIKTLVWMAPEERLDTRRRFTGYFMDERPSLSDWSHTLMLNRNILHNQRLMYPLFQEGHRGEWIDWEEDALSAKLSWSSQIHHECALLPHHWNIKPDDGLFTHLLNASEVVDPTFGIHVSTRTLDEPHPSHMWRHPPPQLPFPPTAWQRARELHLKRPGLRFPERPTFRPSIVSFSEQR